MSKLVYTYKTYIQMPPLGSGSEEQSRVFKALNAHHGWPGWSSLDPNVRTPEPPPELVEAQRNVMIGLSIPVEIQIFSDGSRRLIYND